MSFELSSISQAKVYMSKAIYLLVVVGFSEIFAIWSLPEKLNGLLEQPNQL